MAQRLEGKPVFEKSNTPVDGIRAHYEKNQDRRQTIIHVAYDRRSGITDRRKPISLATLLEEFKLK